MIINQVLTVKKSKQSSDVEEQLTRSIIKSVSWSRFYPLGKVNHISNGDTHSAGLTY